MSGDAPPQAAPRPWLRVAVVFAAWTILCLLVTTQTYLGLRPDTQGLPWLRLVLSRLAYWWVWALVTLGVFRLSRVLPIERERWVRPLLAHLLIATLLAVSLVAYYMFLLRLDPLPGRGDRPFAADFVQGLALFFHFDFMTYFGVLGIGHTLAYYERFRRRSLEAARLVPAARRMVARLGDLLRLTLEKGRRQEIPLADELEIVDQYLAIEQIRFQQRLTVEREIAADTLDCQVPSLLLQPLAENAVRHGIEPRPKGGRIVLRAVVADGRLDLEVADDGPGLPADGALRSRTGFGLPNVRARLEQLYGPAGFELRVENRPAGGVSVRASLPARRERAEEEA